MLHILAEAVAWGAVALLALFVFDPQGLFSRNPDDPRLRALFVIYVLFALAVILLVVTLLTPADVIWHLHLLGGQ